MASRTLRWKVILVTACLCVLMMVLQMAMVNNYLTTNTKYPWEHADMHSLENAHRLIHSPSKGQPAVNAFKDITSIMHTNTPSKASIYTPTTAHQTTPLTTPPDLQCTPADRDALSAIERARTVECREYIRNISCLAEAGRLYNHSIVSLCPLGRDPGITFQYVPYSLGKGPLARVVFLLSIHGRAFRQLKQLFKAIYHADHYYIIHVDSRSDYLYRKVTEMAREFTNVYLPPWRMATIWGGASLLQMLLKALEELEYVLTDWNWDFFINLSESDYPLKGNDELVTFLRVHRKNNFVRTHGGDLERFIHKQGLDRTFVECDHHMWRIGQRTLPSTIRFDGGSDWIIINRNFSHYLVTTKDHYLTTLKRYYQFTLLPAESFFHTALINGPMCETYIKTNLRITNWNRKLGCRCQYKDVVDWCGCSPNDYLASNIENLKVPDHNFFARKFEAMVSQTVINLLDAHLYGAYPEATPSMDAYWENVFSADDTISRPGDSQFSVYHSFLRRFLENVGGRARGGASCLSQASVKDVVVYVKGERFAGFVVSVETMDSGERGDFEALFSPVSHVVKHEVHRDAANRIRSLEVGSKWDAKESIFRNYGNILGVWDEPVMAMWLDGGWGGGEPVDIRMHWEDPTGQPVFTHQMKIDPSWFMAYHKPPFEKPLRPGVWRLWVELVNVGVSIIETMFLVFPLTHENMLPLATPARVNAKMADITKGHEGGVNRSAHQEWKRNVFMEGEELHRWADELSGRFWNIGGMCRVGPHLGCISLLPDCSSSEWSTLYPDSKSEIGPVQSNGRIR